MTNPTGPLYTDCHLFIFIQTLRAPIDFTAIIPLSGVLHTPKQLMGLTIFQKNNQFFSFAPV
jgi:hypothetical protein